MLLLLIKGTETILFQHRYRYTAMCQSVCRYYTIFQTFGSVTMHTVLYSHNLSKYKIYAQTSGKIFIQQKVDSRELRPKPP